MILLILNLDPIDLLNIDLLICSVLILLILKLDPIDLFSIDSFCTHIFMPAYSFCWEKSGRLFPIRDRLLLAIDAGEEKAVLRD